MLPPCPAHTCLLCSRVVDLAARKSFGPKDGEPSRLLGVLSVGPQDVWMAGARRALRSHWHLVLHLGGGGQSQTTEHFPLCWAGGAALVDALEDASADHLWQWELRDQKVGMTGIGEGALIA